MRQGDLPILALGRQDAGADEQRVKLGRRGKAPRDLGQEARRIAVVAVEEADDLAPGQGEAAVHRVMRAPIGADGEAEMGKAREDTGRAVAGAAIHHEMLERHALLLRHALRHLRREGRSVEARGDDADRRHGGALAASG